MNRISRAARFLVCLAFIYSFSGRATAAEFDWLQWRGPNRDGASAETGLLQQWPADGPPLAWKAVGLGQGFSSVAIQNGRIFTMGDRAEQECIFALNDRKGDVLWFTPVGKSASNNGYPGPRCTPAADGDRVYAVGSEGDLVCCDTATGQVVWRKDFAEDFGGKIMSSWGYSESPLVDGDKLICTPGGPTAMIVALDKKTGAEIWRSAMPDIGSKGADGAGYSSPVISSAAGRKQYVQFVGRGLIGVAADNGKFLWGYNRIANDIANVATPLVRDDCVFDAAAYESGGAQLKVSAAEDGLQAAETYRLEQRTFQNHHGGMVLVGDYIYSGNGQMQGFPICIEWTTGRVKWGGRDRGPGTGSAAVAYADGRVYYRYEDGTMALVGASPDAYKLYGTFKIPGVEEPSWSHPAIANGRLYLREQDALYCYSLK
jgi:outer membrane protein assembly factor BamB